MKNQAPLLPEITQQRGLGRAAGMDSTSHPGMINMNNSLKQRDQKNSSSLNYRMTTTDSSGGNPFIQSIGGQSTHKQNNNANSSISSSPNSAKNANSEFKKIRNFQNLYEQPAKMREYQQRQRLGPKKVWLFEKLPPLEQLNNLKGGSISSSDYQMQSAVIGDRGLLNQQQLLKKIQRNNEGQIGINIISRQQPNQEALSLMSQSNTGTAATGISTDPQIKCVLRKNTYHQGNNVILMFKSMEILLIEQGYDKAKIHSPIYLPVTQLIDLLKMPKKQLELTIMSNLHYDKQTSSFQYKQREISRSNIHKSPIKKVMPRSKSDDKVIITPIKNSHEDKNGISDKSLPDFIYSSIYIQYLGKDFQACIKLPSIEFSVPSKHLMLRKFLSSLELQEYFDVGFQNWDEILIRQFQLHSKFTELVSGNNMKKSIMLGSSYGVTLNKQLKKSDKKHSDSSDDEKDSKIKQEKSTEEKQEIYLFSQTPGIETQFFKSISDYQNQKILKSTQQMKGCFDREGIIGSIQLKTFNLKIKSLQNSNEFKEKLHLDDWSTIIKFMKKAIKHDKENPAQIIDIIGQEYIKLADTNSQDQFFFRSVKLNFKESKKNKENSEHKNKKDKSKFEQDNEKNHKRSQSLNDKFILQKKLETYFKSQKRSKILTCSNSSDRYLIELEYPLAKLYLDGQFILKPLSEDDCEYLIDQKFHDWKNYLMNQHYRLELNIGSNEPLPRIKEAKREEDTDVFFDQEYRKRMHPDNEIENKALINTRETVSMWFPV
eukprot:403370376